MNRIDKAMDESKTGAKVRLLKDIIGSKKNVYGKAGEVVKITSIEFLPVAIVENHNGNRYPVKIDFLSEPIKPPIKTTI